MSPTVETVAPVTALLRSFIAWLEQPVWSGHSRWAVFQDDDASTPKTPPTARPPTPTAPTTIPATRCSLPVDAGLEAASVAPPPGVVPESGATVDESGAGPTARVT